MDFYKILYANAPCKSELNKKKLSFYHASFLSYANLRIYWENTVLLYAWLIFNYFTLFLSDFDGTNMHLGVLDHAEFIFCA